MRSSREWFISRAGQVQGPFSTAGIRDKLSQGDLTPLDQICQAGGASDLQWKLIFECPEFIQPASTPNAGAGATSSAGNTSAEWVLLRQTTTGQFSLKRSGPYTVDDIALMLREGSINFSDYVWKKGFQRWAQLETLREFNHSLPAEPPKLEIVRALPPSLSIPQSLDLGENGEEEDVFAALPPEIPEPITQEELETLRASRVVGRAADANPANESPSSSIWARVGIAFIISLGVMLALASLRPLRKHHTQSASRGVTLLDSTTTGEPEGYLTILPLDMETHPKLEFEMSAPAKTFLQVQINGHPGQILHRMRFEQTVTLQKKGSEAPVLDLSPLGLPDGTYDISVGDGRIRTEQQVFVGVHNAQFDRELAAHRAEISREQLVERRAVYDMAGHLQGLVDRLPAKGEMAAGEWSQHYSKWLADFQALMRSSSLDQAAAQSAEPALLQAAQGIAKTIREQAAALDTAVKANPAPGTPIEAQVPTTALKNQLRRLQVQASGQQKR